MRWSGSLDQTVAADPLAGPPAGAYGPVVFGGNLDPARADDRFRRWVTSSSVAADYRDRDEINGWARGIAARLAPIL